MPASWAALGWCSRSPTLRPDSGGGTMLVMTDAFDIPLVDISPYVSGGDTAARDAVARDIDTACRTVGFIQVVGHGIPDDAIAGLTSAMDAFFSMPLNEKCEFVTPPSVNRGYSAPKSEDRKSVV